MSHEIAIAHKDYDVRGGGEILVERMARAFDAPLFVGHGDPDNQPEGLDLDIREIAPDSRWHRLMDMGGAPRGIAHMMHWRDRAPEALGDYEIVITSGNEPLWYMPRDQQTVVAYTHSTPRWMYDLYHESDGFIGRTYQQAQRRLYEGVVKRPDLWVCNSDLVARRVRRYWAVPDEKIRVVYPPVNVDEFDPDDAPTQDFYLHLGRLAGHKRVDSIVDAWHEIDAPLKIAGTGPEREQLEVMAPDHVEFLGYVSEQRKRELMAAAKAHLYPCQNEDFGMVPIESMAAGTPVIGVREGFTQFQIQDGKTGLTYEFGSGELVERVREFEHQGVSWSADQIAGFANRFNAGRFEREMKEIVREADQQARVIPEWEDEQQYTQRDRLTTRADGGGSWDA